jgi:hypothetical protein
MQLTFQAVTLDTDTPDRDAVIVFREGQLLAVLSRLSDIHGELVGQWFVEAMFCETPARRPPVFESVDRFQEWLALPDAS